MLRTLFKADEADRADMSETISGAEMKTGILLDLPDDDTLKEDLTRSQVKLTKLAKKHFGSVRCNCLGVDYSRTLSESGCHSHVRFKTATTGEAMEPLCARIWDVVPGLQ